jgi:hypothetical protein
MLAGETQCGGAEELSLRQPGLQAHTIRTAAGSGQLHNLALQVRTRAAAAVGSPAIAALCVAALHACSVPCRCGWTTCRALLRMVLSFCQMAPGAQECTYLSSTFAPVCFSQACTSQQPETQPGSTPLYATLFSREHLLSLLCLAGTMTRRRLTAATSPSPSGRAARCCTRPSRRSRRQTRTASLGRGRPPATWATCLQVGGVLRGWYATGVSLGLCKEHPQCSWAGSDLRGGGLAHRIVTCQTRLCAAH